MGIINWKKIFEVDGKERIEILVEQMELEIKANEFCIKKLRLEIEYAKKYLS